MSLPNTVDINASVYDAILHIFEKDLGSIIISDSNKLKGIISRKDLIKICLSGKNIEKIPVSIIMTRTPHIIYCKPDDNIIDAIKKIIDNEIDTIPVVDEEMVVVGRFTKTNIAKLYVENIRRL